MANFEFEEGLAYQKASAPNTTTPAYADSIQSTELGAGGDVIIPKLADEVIPFIRQQSYVRQFFRTIEMPTLTFQVPKINQGADVFFVDEAKPTPFTQVSTETVLLQAKKIMTALALSSELTEDNIVPILPHIKRDIAKAFALAEEEIFLYGKEAPGTGITGSTYWTSAFRYFAAGDTGGANDGGVAGPSSTNAAGYYPRNKKWTNVAGGTAANDVRTDTTYATESCWFQNDKRFAFDGLSVLSEPGSAPGTDISPTSVDAGSRPLNIDDVNTAIERLGVFGRDKSQLIFITSLREEKTLRGDPTILTTLERFGPSAVFLTGEIGKVYGISTVATNLIPTSMGTTWVGTTPGPDTVDVAGTLSEAFVVNRNALLIGDRRLFTLKASDIPFMLADQLLLVATERIALAAQFRRAVVKIDNIAGS